MNEKSFYRFLMVVVLAIFASGYATFTHGAEDSNSSVGPTYWLSMNIYHEARGESTWGKFLVALVTLDRKTDGRWGDTIKDVVTAKDQFSWYWDHKPDIPTNKKAWKSSKRVAKYSQWFYNVFGPFVEITYYHNDSVKPAWADKMEYVCTAGSHTFYKEK